MTTSREEERAINWASSFLCRLTVPKETPRVPTEIREEAERIMRHFPMPLRVSEFYEDSNRLKKLNATCEEFVGEEMARYNWAKDSKLTLKQKLKCIDYEINYESALGIHTYHLCTHCNQHNTRAGKCVYCLKKERKEIIKCSTKK